MMKVSPINSRPSRLLGNILLISGLLCAVACACQVPVFRYALERWQPDKYQLFVVSDGPLDRSEGKLLDPLKKLEQNSDALQFPIQLTAVDINSSNDPRLKEAWKKRANKQKPMLAIFYPRGSDAPSDVPAFSSPLEEDTVRSLVDSPTRTAVLDGLTQGQSAVWILVSSGDPKKDSEAYETLQKQLKLDAEWLELPSAEELEVDPQVLADTKIKLKIDFSIVKLDRHDPKEDLLLSLLINSESDLITYDEPLAFPVFGRGRVLYALVGKGIAPDTIRTASAFMVGPCSCQVKDQNPGFDLLMNCNWDKAVGSTLVSEPLQSGPVGANLEPKLLPIPPGRSSTR